MVRAGIGCPGSPATAHGNIGVLASIDTWRSLPYTSALDPYYVL
jgi:hypothetical protein